MRDAAYGPMNQTAFIVTNLEAAIDWWTSTMQVGPFFIFPTLVPVKGDYRGTSHVPDIRAAIGYSGELMIELIEPHNASIFQEFLAREGKGMQHFSAFADDMEIAQASIEARGGKRIQGTTYEDGSQVAYFAMTPDETIILEIAALQPAALAIFDAIKAAGASWDGVTKTISLG